MKVSKIRWWTTLKIAVFEHPTVVLTPTIPRLHLCGWWYWPLLIQIRMMGSVIGYTRIHWRRTRNVWHWQSGHELLEIIRQSAPPAARCRYPEDILPTRVVDGAAQFVVLQVNIDRTTGWQSSCFRQFAASPPLVRMFSSHFYWQQPRCISFRPCTAANSTDWKLLPR